MLPIIFNTMPCAKDTNAVHEVALWNAKFACRELTEHAKTKTQAIFGIAQFCTLTKFISSDWATVNLPFEIN